MIATFKTTHIHLNISLLIALLLTIGTAANNGAASADAYRAEVVYTEYGIPHITAGDYGSLGYGEGYVAARDHVCNISDAITTARGEQALFFGAGDKNAHVMSDIVMRALRIPEVAKEVFNEQHEEIQEWISGFTEGYNRYIRESKVTSWCKGDDVVREISPEDVVARLLSTVQTLPRLAAMIVAAQPPVERVDASSTFNVSKDQFAMAAEGIRMNGMGSNGWAIGKNRTENGRGMLLANPHYPWNGTNRFWEKHLTIPGKLNIYGAGLLGIPGVAIGFNENIGWTHTVSSSQRLAVYRLKLVPGDPTSYYYDRETRKMISRTVEVQVKGDDGKVTTESHTVWFSHYGPMVVMPGFGWNKKVAYSIKDANAENYYAFQQWREMSVAKNMDALKDAHRKWNAMPWVNTIATSSDGRAVYLDNSNVGNLSDEAIRLWQEKLETDMLTKMVFQRGGMPLLDGSDSQFEFQVDPRTLIKGVVPYDKKPQVDRNDFVFNSNDSYWLTNPSAPLTGYSPLYGPVETARSLRTRMNAVLLSDTSPSGHAGEDGKFTLREMQNALFSNRSLTAEMLRDELLDALSGIDSVIVKDKTIDLREARKVLADYNGRLDLNSKGAVLFREWLTAYGGNETRTNNELFAEPFDVSDPVNTPSGLGDKKIAAEKLGHAVQVLKRAGLKLDSALGDAQFAHRSGIRIAVHGGNRYEGIANLQVTGSGDWRGYTLGSKLIEGSQYLTDKGYPVIHGSSFILCLNYTDDGPVAEAILSYSQSGDPSSEHYTDQTRMYAKKQWRPVYYTKEDIKANAVSTEILTGARK